MHLVNRGRLNAKFRASRGYRVRPCHRGEGKKDMRKNTEEPSDVLYRCQDTQLCAKSLKETPSILRTPKMLDGVKKQIPASGPRRGQSCNPASLTPEPLPPS